MLTNTVDRSLEVGRESSRSWDMYILHAKNTKCYGMVFTNLENNTYYPYDIL